jgi:hypothetical protein
MENSIAKKLKTFLSGEIDSECKVVYLLAECRKLLEIHSPDLIPFALKLYCHCALHVDLHYRNTTLRFLERVDEFADSVLAENRLATEMEMFRDFIFLDTFRNQLRQFLKIYDLPTTVL